MTQRLRYGVALVAIAFTIAACGDDSETATTASTEPAITTAVPTTVANATVQTASDPKLGPILVGSNGITLYRFTKDTSGTSMCVDACATKWPPLVEASGTPTAGAGVPGTLATTTRADGTKQVTYDGMPLYRFSGDAKPGDTTGQGVGGVWFVATPMATSASASTTSATAKAAGGTTTTRRATTSTAKAAAATTTSGSTNTSAATTTTAAVAPTTTACPYPPCY